jgi:hypothetical protein
MLSAGLHCAPTYFTAVACCGVANGCQLGHCAALHVWLSGDVHAFLSFFMGSIAHRSSVDGTYFWRS